MQAPEPSSGSRKQDILRQALKRNTSSERAAFLDGACGDDAALRMEMEALLVGKGVIQGEVGLNVDDAGVRVEGDAADRTPTLLDETPVIEGAGTVIGRYKLVEQIGEGGFGVVYLAEQQEPVKRQVALKIIKLGMDTRQVVARFEAERQALALMDHPNIAKVFDAGATDTGRPFFVMELVKGVPIPQYCDQEKFSTQERLKLFISICQAIQHAHQKGIIHRDIKPSNILVTLQEGTPVPKVIDFGIAKATQQRLTDKTLHTHLQQFIGTPAYMSPEQAEMSGLDIDTRSDIYSLGVLLYELLVGKTPFDSKELLAAGLDEIRRTIREKEPVRPSTRLSTLGKEELTTTTQRRGAEAPKLINLLRGDLDWIVMKCLEKDRTRRYETANGLAMDIERHLKCEPVIARPPSTAYRFRKLVRRNRLVVTAGGSVGVVLVLGIVLSTWQAIEASRARNAEETQRIAAQTERDKAQSARQAENQARVQADAEKAEARRLLYAANMNLGQQAWEQNNIGRLRQLLEETQASPDRGFEWYYWQRQTHLALRTLRGRLTTVTAVAFSPDGRRIATGSDNESKVWDADSGRELFKLSGHTASILSVGFSPDGRRIVTGSWDKAAKVWEAASGRELLTLNGHSAPIFSVAFSPDGRRILTGSDDRTAKVWDAASGRELLELKGHMGPILSAGFSPDGRRIVTSGGDKTAREWEAHGGRELLTLRGHSSDIWSVAFSPDGQRIVTGSDDQTAKVWDADSGRELLTLKGHLGPLRSVAFSRDGQRIVTGSWDQTARVWDAASGRELLRLKGHAGPIWSVALSFDGRRIATASLDGTAKVWATDSDWEVRTLQGQTAPILSVAFSPDGRRIVAGSFDQTAKVWEAASGLELLTFNGHTGPIGSVAFSPDGRRIVTGSDDQTAKMWEADSGRELFTLKGHISWIRSVAFSPDGRRIVAGSGDKTVKVWEAASGRELLTLRGHTAPIKSVVFSPDGQRIVTGSDDRTAKVWETDSGRELLELKGHTGPIGSAVFSPDGSRIVTGSEDQTAKIWETARAEQVAAWQQEEQAAVGYLAGSEREWAAEQERRRIARARDEGAVKRWLILAPIALAASQSGAEGLDVEQIEGEGRLRPKAGETRFFGRSEIKWQKVALEDYVFDFNAILGHRTTRSVAYAVCYIWSEVEQRGLKMLVGSNDEAKVYLNGKQVHKYPFGRAFGADGDIVQDIALNAGLNVLVFKVANEVGDWLGSIRFTDSKGDPVKGIKVALDPEAKD